MTHLCVSLWFCGLAEVKTLCAMRLLFDSLPLQASVRFTVSASTGQSRNIHLTSILPVHSTLKIPTSLLIRPSGCQVGLHTALDGFRDITKIVDYRHGPVTHSGRRH